MKDRQQKRDDRGDAAERADLCHALGRPEERNEQNRQLTGEYVIDGSRERARDLLRDSLARRLVLAGMKVCQARESFTQLSVEHEQRKQRAEHYEPCRRRHQRHQRHACKAHRACSGLQDLQRPELLMKTQRNLEERSSDGCEKHRGYGSAEQERLGNRAPLAQDEPEQHRREKQHDCERNLSANGETHGHDSAQPIRLLPDPAALREDGIAHSTIRQGAGDAERGGRQRVESVLLYRKIADHDEPRGESQQLRQGLHGNRASKHREGAEQKGGSGVQSRRVTQRSRSSA